MLRVILEPLIGQAPLVGGVTLFFIRRPVSVQTFSVFIQYLFLFIPYCEMRSSVKLMFKALNCFSDPKDRLDWHYQHFGQRCLWVSFHRKL